MSSYERIADLPLEVESLRFEGRELQFSPEFTRATTLIQLHGPGGETGVGEDVVYDEIDHVNLQADGPGTIDLAGGHHGHIGRLLGDGRIWIRQIEVE